MNGLREIERAYRQNVGTQHALKNEEILELFRPVEGFVSFYYGNIRNGKTYSATADILELLERGETVFANWNVNFDGFDERDSFRIAFVKFLFGKKNFYVYPKKNFHYFHPDEINVEYLGRLVNVHIFIDEGQWIFNSHVRNPDPEKRKLILHNGHYCRSLNIISQRPTNVFLDMRSQVQIWYKCEKRMTWPLLIFQRTEFQQMKNNEPDEGMPVGRPKTYVADRRIMEAYSTHAMRAKDAIESVPEYQVYTTTFLERLLLVLSYFVPRRWRDRPQDGLAERHDGEDLQSPQK